MTNAAGTDRPLGTERVLLVGAGAMGRAIVEGTLAAGVMRAEQWLAAEPDAERRHAMRTLGVRCETEVRTLFGELREDDQVLLAVKPQSLGEVAVQLGQREGGRAERSRIVISILAGTPTTRIRAALGEWARVIRAMPNLGASVGRSTTALAIGAGARAGDEGLAACIFGAVGRLVERVDESMMDAFTAIAGSGPAYVFLLAEAMEAAAREQGFDREAAARIVREVIGGSAALMDAAKKDPAELRASVTSKGGTTEAAVRVLENAKAKDLLIRAMHAARERGVELSRM